MKRTLDALHSYSKDFYSKSAFKDSTNVVGSPLASWFLLASIARGIDYTGNPALKESIESRLHMTVENAAQAVLDILKRYPSLNYVVKSWATNDLEAIPAVEKWVDNNTMIPHQASIPSQEDINAWAAKNTKNLIETFPITLDSSVEFLVANIIYSKLTWQTPFKPVFTSSEMSPWGVKTVLGATPEQHDVLFCEDKEGDIFAIYKLAARGVHKESMCLVTCLTRDAEPLELMEVMHKVDTMTVLLPSDTRLNNSVKGMFVSGSESATKIEVRLPAWDANGNHNLMSSPELGYQDVMAALSRNAKKSLQSEAKQVAVAKFDKEGFEAAALTTVCMTRAAASFEQLPQLNFTKPFVFVSYVERIPVFSGFVTEAKEGK